MIEINPFFRHERLTKSFKLKEPSVLFGQIITIASIGTEPFKNKGLGILKAGERSSGGTSEGVPPIRVSAKLKLRKQKLALNHSFEFLGHF